MTNIKPDTVVMKERQCGGCSLCCKIFPRSWLDRTLPVMRLCPHCEPGNGCLIYPDRPKPCAEFYCQWRLDESLGEEWRPDRAGFLLHRPARALPIELIPDPERPQNWRRPQYLPRIRKAAAIALAQGSALMLVSGQTRSVILPDGEVPLPTGNTGNSFRVVQSKATGSWYVDMQG